MDEQFIIVVTTCPSGDQARQLATILVDRRLAACVQENPVSSTYRWQGRVERDDEVRLLIKTQASRFDEICDVVRDIVSYDNPQIIGIPILKGAQDYLDWIVTETSPDR